MSKAVESSTVKRSTSFPPAILFSLLEGLSVRRGRPSYHLPATANPNLRPTVLRISKNTAIGAEHVSSLNKSVSSTNPHWLEE
jgi:hypothetical protein